MNARGRARTTGVTRKRFIITLWRGVNNLKPSGRSHKEVGDGRSLSAVLPVRSEKGSFKNRTRLKLPGIRKMVRN